MKRILAVILLVFVLSGCDEELLDRKKYKGWIVLEHEPIGKVVILSDGTQTKGLKLYTHEFNQLKLGDTIKWLL